MIKRMLVAYDGSAPAEAAFALGLAFARTFEATLDVLAVARPPDIGDDVETGAAIEGARRQLRQALRKLETRAKESGAAVTFHVQVGHPAECILAFAEHHGIDHIVIGHRGTSVLRRWLVGSVSRQVIDHAPCSVTVVR